MSYQEKRIVVSIGSGIVFLAIYFLLILSTGIINSEDVKVWATFMLKFIIIGVIAIIILQILFHILQAVLISVRERNKNEKIVEKIIKNFFTTDEMDKLIELKAGRVGFAFAGFGFIGALLAIVLNYTLVCMLNTMFISFVIGTIVEGFVTLYYYKKGIK